MHGVTKMKNVIMEQLQCEKEEYSQDIVSVDGIGDIYDITCRVVECIHHSYMILTGNED